VRFFKKVLQTWTQRCCLQRRRATVSIKAFENAIVRAARKRAPSALAARSSSGAQCFYRATVIAGFIIKRRFAADPPRREPPA
jgi:hypothetical protein